MAIEVNLPDGSVANFPDDTPPETMKAAIQKRFPPMDVAREAMSTFRGFNIGLDTMYNLPNQLVNVAGAGINKGAEALGYEKPLPDQLIEPARLATRFNDDYEPQSMVGKALQTTGEVAGGAIAPEAGILARGLSLASKGPQALTQAYPVFQKAAEAGVKGTVKAAALPTVGAGVGVDVARENDLGPIGETVGGLVGGKVLPNVGNVASRTYGGARAGVKYAQKQVERAQNPEASAYKDIADQATKTGLDLQAVHDEVAPTPSANLAKRGLTPEDMATIVSRRMKGENAADIGQDYGIKTGDTVQKYVDDFLAENPTNRNLIDLAKETLEPGAAQPLANQARADMAIADDPLAIQRLVKRQQAQPGRVADIIEQSSIDGRTLSQELDRLATTGKAEERAAYKQVADNAQPIDLTDVIGGARKAALRRGGEIGKGLNDAVDLFFKKVAQPKRISAVEDVRLKEMQERIDKAKSAENPNQDTIKRLERRFDAMRDDLEFNQNAKPEIVKPGAPIDDVRSFIDARDELSQMTQQSMKDGKPTMLTAELTKLREALNAAARKTNTALEAADAKYSGNRSIERMIERGGELGKKLTGKTKQALRDFNKLTPTQQEIQRVAFEDKMASEALNVKRGSAAADQFNSDAFDLIVDQMYPKSAGKAIYERGQALLRNLKREAITTETARDVLSGSRTAPLQNDIAALMEGPKAAADLITGRFGKVLENLSNRLSRQIGKKAAEHRVRILTETDPAEMLPMLRRLAQEAKTSHERQLYEMAIKQFMMVPRNRVVEGAVAVDQTRERR